MLKQRVPKGLTKKELEQAEELAHKRGYESFADFVRAWIEGDSEQAWFWSETWQAAERKVDEEIASGEYQDFDTMDELIADLLSDE